MNIITKQTTTFNMNAKETKGLLSLLLIIMGAERKITDFEIKFAENMYNAIKKSLESE